MFVTIHVKSPTAPMPGHLDARQFLRHVGVRLRWRRSRLKLNWQRGLAKGSGNVENIHPNGWRAPKLMVCKRWHQLMARIRYLCWVSGLQSWIGVSSKLDFLEHFSPKWWLWCWYFFTFCDEAIQHEKLRELWDLWFGQVAPWEPISTGWNFKPGKKGQPPWFFMEVETLASFHFRCNFPIPMGVSGYTVFSPPQP